MMKTILVVMDDTIIGSLIVHMVARNTPHLVILVNNGSEALALTREVKPDLFLLDSLLPDMNGKNLYNCLHKRKALQDVPAIIFNMSLDQPDMQQESEKRELVCINDPLTLPGFLGLLEQTLS